MTDLLRTGSLCFQVVKIRDSDTVLKSTRFESCDFLLAGVHIELIFEIRPELI